MKSAAKFLSLVLVISTAIMVATPALAQAGQESQAQTAVAKIAEVSVDSIAQTPTTTEDSSAPIKGEINKKRSLLGKIGSFMADLFFGGEYPDGYTSFVSY